jgi:hypothetical protein
MAADEHPLDPEVRQRVAELLYGLLPALYRVRDEPPKGQGDLRRFLSILAAPLAEVRQSVESLQADLFIDSARDSLLPSLAEMVGTTLEFPDAATNRRDVRGTASWRRRKGTPSTLEALSAELLELLVSTQEGWKRLLITQDINLTRPERTVPDVRDALLAEASSGPLDMLFHALGEHSHPRGVTHWIHPTQLFPVRDGTPVSVSNEPIFTFHPQGRRKGLRVPRGRPEDSVETDRLLPVHLDRTPERYHGEGKAFAVRICGLPAAVEREEAPLRQPSAVSADLALVEEGRLRLTELEKETRGWTTMFLEVAVVPLVPTSDPALWEPSPGTRSTRGAVMLTPTSEQHVYLNVTTAFGGPRVVMLRLWPYKPAQSAWFPGATIELAAEGLRPRLASGDPALAAEGFLRGALLIRLPATWVDGDFWMYLAADGSVREAMRDGALLPVRKSGAFYLLEGEALTTGPGPAWPPATPRASDEPLSHIPPSPVRGPVVMHGGKALRSTGEAVPAGTRMALSFAARYRTRHGIQYQPILRLEWEGSEPWENAHWSAANTSGRLVAPSVRFPWLTRIREQAPEELQLVVRLEGDVPGLVLPPCEVAWMLEDGGTVLLHLPTLSTLHTATRDPRWETTHVAVGPAVGLAVDGSSRWPDSGRIARYALGASPVAPIRQHATLRRRRLRGCRLELGGREGHLDVDPTRGLFALSGQEPPQHYPRADFWPSTPFGPPGPVSVDFQEGFSGHVGARSAPREPLLGARQPVPTRVVVSKAGPRDTTPPGVPHYLSLTEALRAIQADGTPAAHEIIQLDDSATHEEFLTWPDNISRLTLQAAEGERPILQFSYQPTPAPELRYERLVLRGLMITGRIIFLPQVETVELQFCTWPSTGMPFLFAAPPGREVSVAVFRCVMGGLELRGPGKLEVRDSVVAAGTDGRALLVPEGMCELERVTVLGSTRVLVLEASEVIFDGPVEVEDRFHGCVRYSRVPEGAVLPRRHRVVEGVEVRLVTRDPFDPAYARLAEDCEPALTRGAEDGSEPGAFHHVRLVQRLEALARRLTEYTPAGLTTGITRLD